MSIFQDLIGAVEERKKVELELTKAKTSFEEATVDLRVLLSKLIEEEDKLREEVCMTLEKNDETNVIVDDMSINRQVRKTLQINDPSALRSAIIYHQKELENLGIDINVAKDAFKEEVVVKDKKLAMEIIEKYENIEGKLLEGVEQKRTQFLTVKQNN